MEENDKRRKMETEQKIREQIEELRKRREEKRRE